MAVEDAGWSDGQDLVVRLRFATARLSRLLRQESSTDNALTLSRYSALTVVESDGPLRMTSLARAERLSKSSITRVVSGLLELGLIEAIPDETDGRSQLVQVTERGREVLATTSERADAFLSEQLAALSDLEYAVLEPAVLLLERLTTQNQSSMP